MTDSFARVLGLSSNSRISKLEELVETFYSALSYKGVINSIEELQSKEIINGNIYECNFEGEIGTQDLHVGDIVIGFVDGDSTSEWQVVGLGSMSIKDNDSIILDGGNSTSE